MNETAPSTAFSPRQIPLLRRSSVWLHQSYHAIEKTLESERSQLPLWAPILLGAGICAWLALATPAHWIAWTIFWLGVALGIGALGRGGRLAQSLAIAAILLAAGCLLVWGKAMLVGAPPLARPAMVEMQAKVRSVDPLVARGLIRLDLAPIDRPDLPNRVRVNAKPKQLGAQLAPDDVVAVRARLMPPAPAALPGAYNFAQRAYFEGIGASGRALGKVERVSSAGGGQQGRQRLAAHIASRLPGGDGTIAIALATGTQSWISEADADAMRRSGLAHLLSISGLHVSALIGGVIFIVMRLLALSPYLALRWPLLLVAACAGGAAGIGYTLFTGAEVPTIRSCIAAVLVIIGLALGREAISLRLIATGALFVMLFWPEAVIGPSFQMSFAAVTAIVALYEYPPTRAFFARREEGGARQLMRSVGALLITGLAVELVLTPIAFAHFHRSGLLGALANMIAIPLTSFVVMPFEVMALVLDIAGLGAPAWWVVGAALKLLLWLAHYVSAQPYATISMPIANSAAFPLAMLGLLWLMLWRTRMRWLGIPLAITGFALTLSAPAPDILVTSDGRHVAWRADNGALSLLRDRAGDYVRTTFAEAAAYEGEFSTLADAGNVTCSQDLCEAALKSGESKAPVKLLATRSNLLVPYPEFVAACARADIVIADRRLPDGCQPRWAKLDRPALAAMGGALILLDERRIVSGRDPRDRHPWVIQPLARTSTPGK